MEFKFTRDNLGLPVGYAEMKRTVTQNALAAVAERVDAIKTIIKEIRDIQNVSGVQVAGLQDLVYSIQDLDPDWYSSNC